MTIYQMLFACNLLIMTTMLILFLLYTKERWYNKTIAALSLLMTLDLLGFYFFTTGWMTTWWGWEYADLLSAVVWAGFTVFYFVRPGCKCCDVKKAN